MPIIFRLIIFTFRENIIKPTNTAGIVAKTIGKKLTLILLNSKYLFLYKYNRRANKEAKCAVVSYKKFLSSRFEKTNSIIFR
jgi:hypothetical protein